MAKHPLPSPAELRQLLDYDAASGALIWRGREGKWSSRWNARHAGKPAGGVDRHCYITIKIYDRSLAAHRVIWAMVHGSWPECIDHRNGDPSDNRLNNLRAVSRKMNQRNQRRHSSNSSGRTGVCWAAKAGKWLASIKIDGQAVHLGYFTDKNEAVQARISAERQHGFTGRQ